MLKVSFSAEEPEVPSSPRPELPPFPELLLVAFTRSLMRASSRSSSPPSSFDPSWRILLLIALMLMPTRSRSGGVPPAFSFPDFSVFPPPLPPPPPPPLLFALRTQMLRSRSSFEQLIACGTIEFSELPSSPPPLEPLPRFALCSHCRSFSLSASMPSSRCLGG